MSRRVLVAGVGNMFLGDDAFGCEVLRLLAQRTLPAGVRARDFGTRALDLAYELTSGWDAAIFVDAAPRGGTPGTLYVIEPVAPRSPAQQVDGHSLRLEQVLGIAAGLGPLPPLLRLVACEPDRLEADEDGPILSTLVGEAVGPAAARVEVLAAQLAGLTDA